MEKVQWLNSSKSLFAILEIFLCGIILNSCGAPSYRSFVEHDQKYYAELAQACDELLSVSPSLLDSYTKKVEVIPGVFKQWVFQGDEKWLPSTLRGLHATTITVHDDLKPKKYWVSIMVGVTRPGFGIAWKENDNGLWELQVFPEGAGPVLYSIKK